MRIAGRAACMGWMAVVFGMLAAPVVVQAIVVMVPARMHMIRLGMDITQMRGGALISYQRAPDTGEMVLHRWDSRARDWLDLPQDAFMSGIHPDRSGGTLYLIGLDRELPPGLAASAAIGASRVERIPTLLPAEAVNVFNRTLKFSRREWRMLADRYNLEIVDRNEERRRWGRFGRPDGQASGPATERPSPGVADEPLSPMPALETRPAEPVIRPVEAPAVRPVEPRVAPSAPQVRPEKGLPIPAPVQPTPDPDPADK